MPAPLPPTVIAREAEPGNPTVERPGPSLPALTTSGSSRMLRQHRVDQPVDSGRALALVAHAEAHVDHQRLPARRGDTDGVAHRARGCDPWPETLPLARSAILRARSWAPGATPSNPRHAVQIVRRGDSGDVGAVRIRARGSDRASAPGPARRGSPPLLPAACRPAAPSRTSHAARDSRRTGRSPDERAVSVGVG